MRSIIFLVRRYSTCAGLFGLPSPSTICATRFPLSIFCPAWKFLLILAWHKDQPFAADLPHLPLPYDRVPPLLSRLRLRKRIKFVRDRHLQIETVATESTRIPLIRNRQILPPF